MGRIVGGDNAPAGLYPYQVSLQIKVPSPHMTIMSVNRWEHYCGGSIVSARHIVTAAHCLNYPASELSVLAGTTQLNGDGQRVMIASYLKHPNYVELNTSDIAIVRTKQALRLTPNRVSIFSWSSHVWYIKCKTCTHLSDCTHRVFDGRHWWRRRMRANWLGLYNASRRQTTSK